MGRAELRGSTWTARNVGIARRSTEASAPRWCASQGLVIDVRREE